MSIDSTAATCGSYRPGHCVHWIQANHAVKDRVDVPIVGRVLDVQDDGIIVVGAGGVVHRLWNHDPARVRDWRRGRPQRNVPRTRNPPANPVMTRRPNSH